MGDTVLMSGPRQGGHWVDGMAKKVGFVGGGTGITPMISIFHCYHVLEQPPVGWPEGTGRIPAEILRRHLPPPGPETVLFLCGPPPMMNALEEILRGLGYPEESVILP